MLQQSRISPEQPTASFTVTGAVFTGTQGISLERIVIPEPGPTQVRVRLEGCGVCASNLPVWEGRSWFDYPLSSGQPGHEGWGHIDALGTEVTHLNVGDRVAILSEHAYAEYDVAAADAVVRLPAVRVIAFSRRPFALETAQILRT
jgi:NADPH:quinone reductase-like Zn-dependent oxidoreductase